MISLDIMGRHRLVKALLDGDLPVDEVLRAYDIHSFTYDLGPDLLGMAYLSRRQNYYIVVCNRLAVVKKEEVFFHELKHVLLDLPKMPHVLGLDMQWYQMERDADIFLREARMAYNALGIS